MDRYTIDSNSLPLAKSLPLSLKKTLLLRRHRFPQIAH